MGSIFNNTRVASCVTKIAKEKDKYKSRYATPVAAAGAGAGAIQDKLNKVVAMYFNEQLAGFDPARTPSAPRGFSGLKFDLGGKAKSDAVDMAKKIYEREGMTGEFANWAKKGKAPWWRESTIPRLRELPHKSVDPLTLAGEIAYSMDNPKFLKAMAALRKATPIAGLGLLGHAAITADRNLEKPTEMEMATTGYAAPAVAAIGPLATQAEELRNSLRAKRLLDRADIPAIGPQEAQPEWLRKMPSAKRLVGKKIGVPAKDIARQILRKQLIYGLGGLGAIAPAGIGAIYLKDYIDTLREKAQKAEKSKALKDQAIKDSNPI